MRVLTVNAGSSSVKLDLLDDQNTVEHHAELPAGTDGFDPASLGQLMTTWVGPDVIGHRIVHGGEIFSGPIRIDAAVRAQLKRLTDLARPHTSPSPWPRWTPWCPS